MIKQPRQERGVQAHGEQPVEAAEEGGGDGLTVPRRVLLSLLSQYYIMYVY